VTDAQLSRAVARRLGWTVQGRAVRTPRGAPGVVPDYATSERLSRRLERRLLRQAPERLATYETALLRLTKTDHPHLGPVRILFALPRHRCLAYLLAIPKEVTHE
jgi:hypothetical protein